MSLSSRCPPFVTERLRRLRRPTRRELVWALAALPALLLAYVLLLIPFTPAISDIRKAKLELPAQVLSSDGQLLTEFKWANRAWVPLKDISPSVVNALIATEDHRFYEHFGLDWRRTASATLQTFSGNRQGGSTLTQQLARNLFPQEIGRAPTLTRKLKEWPQVANLIEELPNRETPAADVAMQRCRTDKETAEGLEALKSIREELKL